MKATVKDLVSNIGYETSDFARRFGGNTAELAKQVRGSAKRVARRVGPKRGLIGLAVFSGLVVGTVFLVRYLRARRMEEEVEDIEAAEEPLTEAGRRTRKMSRAKRRAMNAITH